MPDKRTSFWTGVRDISPLIPAAVSYGLVVGAAINQAGLGIAESVAMSTGIYGAAAQLAAVGLWDEGAPLLVIVGTALVINARFVIYSTSIAHVLPTNSWLEAVGLGYLLRDGAYAATMTRAVPNPAVSTKHYYLGAAFTDWLVWLLATSFGVYASSLVPNTWSLDFIVPLVFVALLAGALKSRIDVETALIAAGASVILVPLLPMQIGLLAAIVLGIVWGYLRDPGAATRADIGEAVSGIDDPVAEVDG
jgi:predicted branched-subunit amino acid permease